MEVSNNNLNPGHEKFRKGSDVTWRERKQETSAVTIFGHGPVWLRGFNSCEPSFSQFYYTRQASTTHALKTVMSPGARFYKMN